MRQQDLARLTQGLPSGHPADMEAGRKVGGWDRSVCDRPAKREPSYSFSMYSPEWGVHRPLRTFRGSTGPLD